MQISGEITIEKLATWIGIISVIATQIKIYLKHRDNKQQLDLVQNNCLNEIRNDILNQGNEIKRIADEQKLCWTKFDSVRDELLAENKDTREMLIRLDEKVKNKINGAYKAT
jgi:hypothetical protein